MVLDYPTGISFQKHASMYEIQAIHTLGHMSNVLETQRHVKGVLKNKKPQTHVQGKYDKSSVSHSF